MLSTSTNHGEFDPSEYTKQKGPKEKTTEVVVTHLHNLPKQDKVQLQKTNKKGQTCNQFVPAYQHARFHSNWS